MTNLQIVLASKSAARRMILSNAGIEYSAFSSDVDEDVIKRQYMSEGADLDTTAQALALAKAKAVSADHPEALVIGADQILGLEGRGYDKPGSMREAAARLSEFSGKTHYLHTACCVVQNGATAWTYVSAPALTMRLLSHDRIERYLQIAGTGILSSVGAYQLEGPGAQLFSKIEGDYFSILGLPLLPLLDFLRSREVLEF